MGIGIGIVAAAVTIWIFSYVDNWRRDLTTNFAKLDESSADPLLRPVRSDDSVQQMTQRLHRFVDQQPHWHLENQTAAGDDAVKLHLTRTTSIFRYVDDLHVTITRTAADGSVLQADSQSRVGKGDLGQNPRNLKELVRGITD